MDYLVKLVIFVPFVVAVKFFITTIMSYFSSYLATLSMSGLLCQFGIFTGLNLFLSIVVASFFVKQVLSFWK